MAEVPETSPVGELLGAVLKACGGDASARVRVSDKNDDLAALALAVNQLIALLGAHVEESARLRAAGAATEERYRRLEALIPGLVFTYQLLPGGSPCFPYANAATCDLYHVEPEDLLRDGSLITGKIHPDDRERRDRAIQRSAETLQPFREELRYVVDGEVRWHDTMLRVERQTDGSVLGHGIMLDITDRKRAEEALRESEAKYRRLYESLMDAFAGADMEGRLTEFNRAYEEMLGYSGEELRQLTYEDLTPEKWHPVQARILREQVLTRGFSDVFEKEYRRKDGSVFPTELRTFLMRDSAGRPSGTWAIVRDITARKQAEAERAKLEARLFEAQKMESVGRLAGGVAHDFNNMLTVILGFTELALEKLRPDDPLRDYLAEIRKAANHSKEITKQLLAFSRRQIVTRQPINLDELIASRKSTLSRLIGEDIDLRYLPGKQTLRVNADAAQMEQILVNLALNARDAMPDGGTLTIQTRVVTIDEAYRRLHPDFTPGGHVLLAIGDTGAGMDKETLAHCFEPFFTTKETGRGTGLALATVYGIVKQNGGLVNVYSEPGHGTVFKIYLPVIEAESTPPGVQQEGPAAKGEGTILLVEDEDMVRHLTAEMLKSLGYTVVAAATPAEAWSICQTGKRTVDLLLTDVMMPGMNGMQLRDRIVSVLPGVRVLFMSGFTSNDVLRRGVAEENLSFIQKPFSLTDLARAVRAALARDGS
jgi:PAS domain S-box-containing protein